MMQQSSSQLICPICEQIDTVQKVSSLVRSSTAKIDLSGRSTNFGAAGGRVAVMRGYSQLSGHQQTRLGALLAPPPYPRYRSNWMLAGIGLAIASLLAFFPFLVYSASNVKDPSAWSSLVVGGVIAATVLIAKFVFDATQRKAATARVPHWEKAMSTWQQLYYCHRDDQVFIPGTNRFASSDQIRKLF